MEKIHILDCTLRDGGYCNQWRFGQQNIKRIIRSLIESGIDIIECGFLSQSIIPDKDVSRFTNIRDIEALIPENQQDKQFVCMVNYGEYSLEDIPAYSSGALQGIRVAFHKKDMLPALEFCRVLKQKGYKVFVQAMVSLSYTDEEFLRLIQIVNEFEPYAFYVVDSFGVMKQKDLMRLCYMVDHNLKKEIILGYHSHNNMQLAYSNAQAIINDRINRELIIDSSVFGMGRGAGNLNTELFVEYLNQTIGSEYQLKPLLGIIDEVLNRFYQENPWGYSLPNYLSAKYNSHPNYAGYLDAKKTMTVEGMDEIFSMMEDGKRTSFDREYIETLYVRYMSKMCIQEAHLDEFKSMLKGKCVLMIAPGKSSKDEADKIINAAASKDVVTIGVNFHYPHYQTNFIFVSNQRRFKELNPELYGKCIVTSNIPTTDAYLQVQYKELLNTWNSVEDNAGLMLIKLLIKMEASQILLAGFDGYSVVPEQNFANSEMAFYAKRATFESMNHGMSCALQEFKKQIKIEFLTTPVHLR